MSDGGEKVTQVEIDIRPEVLAELRRALEHEEEYPKERDLLSYILLLGLELVELERRREGYDAGSDELYQELYQDLADCQGEYARLHHAFAEAARDDQTGRMVNSALRREVAATREYLIPRLERERKQLRRRREALLDALGENG
jgi:hypothetical protein